MAMPVKCYTEPYVVYNEVFVTQMLRSGFEFVSQSIEEKQYFTRFQWRSQFINTDVSSYYYSQIQNIVYEIDVIGIPVGSFLLLQALFVGKNTKSCFENIKLKIRCLPKINDDLEEFHENRRRIVEELIPGFIQRIISVFSIQLDDLPIEIKFMVLAMLPLNSIVNMACVSSLWRDISLDENLWMLLVQRHFPDVYKRRVVGQSWKALFKEEFRRLRVLNRRRAFSFGNDGVLLALPPSPRILPIGPPPLYPMLLPRQLQALEVRAPRFMQEFVNDPHIDILNR